MRARRAELLAEQRDRAHPLIGVQRVPVGVEAHRSGDPLVRLRAFLESRGWWDESAQTALGEELDAQIEAAVADYLARPPQPVTAMFDYLYERLPEALQGQREAALREAGDE